MRALIFDAFAGISGDMILGGLIDLGLPEQWLREFVGSLDFEDAGVHIERVDRNGIACARVRFDLPEQHSHRHLRHILEILDTAPVTDVVRSRAAAAFTRIAKAEAKVHGTTVEKVHFHEVGALDAILDVLCAMAAVEQMGFEAFHTHPVAVGRGWVTIEHGTFPVPAPATLGILEGIRLTGFDLEGECTTPTGAAILATLTDGRPPPSTVVVRGTGFGAGSRDPADRPNCLRVIAADVETGGATLCMIQTDIDDLAPEYLPPARESLFAAGALDVTALALDMKKGRPGIRIEALVREQDLQGVVDAMFRNTTTLGVRYWRVERPELERAEEIVEWRGQRIRRKRVFLPGGGTRAKFEYDDVARAAAELGLSPLEVRAALDAQAAPAGPGPES